MERNGQEENTGQYAVSPQRDKIEAIKREVQHHVSEQHGLDFTRDHGDFLVAMIDHLAERIVNEGIRAEPEPRINPALQLKTEDITQFESTIQDYALKGQTMLETFTHITKTILSLLPARFSYTAYCVHITTDLEDWFEGGAVAHYGSGRSGGAIRPVCWHWPEAGEQIEGRWTATRDQILEVIDQFAEFLRLLTNKVKETNEDIGKQLERLSEVWSQMEGQE